jgi:hypothetical protein
MRLGGIVMFLLLLTISMAMCLGVLRVVGILFP